MLSIDITYAHVGWTMAAVAATLLIRFLQQLYHYRTMAKGLPGPPHSLLLGHLKALGEVFTTLPADAHPQNIPTMVKERFDLGDVFVMDLFPFGPPTLVISDPTVMKSVTVTHSLPKHEEVHKFMAHLGGPGNLVSSEGATWKKWRSAFNPGFSASHITSLVPAIVDECQVFCDLMDDKARKNELFRIERAATKLTVDIIGKVVLDASFDSQRKPNLLVDSMMSIIKWMKMGDNKPDFLASINFIRPMVLAYEAWKMNRYLGDILEERFASRKNREEGKSVIDLALKSYLKEIKGTNVDEATTLDPDFKTAAISNLKTFIFAGHDTTSSTIVYVYYYLSKHPEMLAKVRAEHDEVFGIDRHTVGNQLKDSPHLLGKLTYTMAVIREVLRVQPPASTVRGGEKGVSIQDPKTGINVPTEGWMIWCLNVGAHRNENYWSNPHEFQPERHLTTSEDNSANYNSSDAWIAFSKGPRNCIGQELAIVETKVILAMTMRSYDFTSAYDEVYKLKGDGSGYPSTSGGVQTVYGDEAYQVMLGTAKPREGMPCRLRLRT